MYVLADLLVELKAKSTSSDFQTEIIFPGDLEGRETNISDYLYYLYNGQTASYNLVSQLLNIVKKSEI